MMTYSKTNWKDKRAALLIMDMINDFYFIDGDILFMKAIPVAENIALLKKTAALLSVPIIYLNENFGKSDFNILVDYIDQHTLGKEILKILKPDENDYCIFQSSQSAFYSQQLEGLLNDLKIDTIVLTGVKIECSILSTAIDAYIRSYQIIIPKDCVASINPNQDIILNEIKDKFKAEIVETFE